MHTFIPNESKNNSIVDASIQELLQSTSRSLIFTTAVIYLVWHFITTVIWTGRIGEITWLVSVPQIAISIIAFSFVERRYNLAQVVWQVGMAGVIALAVFIYDQPMIAGLLPLLPLFTMVTLGWRFGFISGIGCAVLAYSITQFGPWLPLPIQTTAGIIVACVITSFVGWAATRIAVTMTEWLTLSFEDANQKVEEARRHQVELSQIREDLLQANKELTRLSKLLKEANQVAEEALRIKEEFVANVSHELRTPLNMIIGFCEMISKSPRVYGGKLAPTLMADIAAIQRNGEHLMDLVNDVLDLSQVDAGRMAISKRWDSLQGIIQSAVQVVGVLYDSKGLYIRSELPNQPVPVFCDSTRIREVLLNLLSNASRFTESGGVTIRLTHEPEFEIISVIDTGPGIAPEDQVKLFEPFQQLDTSLHHRHGTSGLGLAISKRFIELHQGKMWVESKLGNGTTFNFTLPTVSIPPDSALVPSSLRWFNPHSQVDGRWRPFKAPSHTYIPRLILVDSGTRLLTLFRRFLDDFEVTHFSNVEEAMEKINMLPAKVILINHPAFREIPNQIFRLNQAPRGLPVVGCWVPGDDEAAERLGAMVYLTKPIERQKLLDTISQLGVDVQRVLVVDDNPEALQLFVRMLSTAEKKYVVFRAKNGQQAMDLMSKNKPDVILLDLVMEGMDGFRVLEKKNNDPALKDIPVIIISSLDPNNTHILTDNVLITRNNGFSGDDLLTLLRLVSSMLGKEDPNLIPKINKGSVNAQSGGVLPGESPE